MPVTQRRADQGARLAIVLHRTLGGELRTARRQAGMSQRLLGELAGVDHSVISRIEAAAQGASVDTYARLFAILGLRLSVKVYPEGEPVRDAAHLRLLQRLRSLLHAVIRMRTEVGLGIEGDRRAWDAELVAGSDSVKLEAETNLEDIQALDRKIALKMQDGKVDRVLLLVADTERNRRIVSAHREALRGRFPLDTRAALACLRAGSLPPAGAIIFL